MKGHNECPGNANEMDTDAWNVQTLPEIVKSSLCSLAEDRLKIIAGQLPFLTELESLITYEYA